MRHRIDVRNEPIEGVPTCDDEDVPILAPGTHPDMGPSWTLYYSDGSGGVKTFSLPKSMARTADEADPIIRGHLTRNTGRDWS